MPRFAKGSPEAKEHMRQMREKRASKDGVAPTPAPEQIASDNVDDLVRRVKELEQLLKQPEQSQQQTPQVNARGSLVGTYEKYLVDPINYPDPTPRLAAEARLQRFAFPLNYLLNWAVSTVSYETIDGIRTKEPRFSLELVQRIMDEDGEPTAKGYVVNRLTFHEDPEAALVIARDNGITVDTSNEKLFLDEMRYLRARDWLLELFYPVKPKTARNKREEVIGNRLVEVIEITSETSETIPFGNLTTKL